MFTAGTQIGKYTLRRKLGQGGFGSVFAAYDETLDREVALKLLNAEHKTSDDVMRRFLQEARLAARISHPGIVTVFECAQISGTSTPADGIAYIAMELLDGESLAHRLHRGGRMAAPTAMEIARQIASALEAAHASGIVHRDLKPDNIFLVRDPAVLHGERVKVLDFGIAKLHHVASSVHTQTNEVFGTPRYMSPEQCRSSTQIDHRSDIYTLGCILFELVTGRPPFVGQPGELFAQHLMVEAPSVLAFVRDTPYHVADLVARMLAKDVAHRPQSMAQVQRELEVGGAVAVGVPPTLPPTGHPNTDAETTLKAAAGVSMIREHVPSRVLMLAGAALALAAAVTLVVWLRDGDGDGAREQPPAAPAQVAAAPRSAPQPQVTPIEEPATDVTGASAAAAASTTPTTPPSPSSSASPPSPSPSPTTSPARGQSAPAGGARTRRKREPTAAADVAVATGTLKLRSSPSCAILVDGKAIGSNTPHELELPAGKHRITLFNDEHDIKDTFHVVIEAGDVERVTRDLHDKIRAKRRNKTINPFGGG